MAHPFPQTKIQPGSQLSFPWVEYNPRVESSWDAAFSPEGVVQTMVMLVPWANIADAVQALLGYSFRDLSGNNNGRGPLQGFVTNTTGNGVNPIVVTSAGHGMQPGTTVLVWVTGVLGNLSANGKYQATIVDANTFSLPIAGNGNYVSGGEWRTMGTRLRRYLPWQHPLWNQLYVKGISSIKGITQQGDSVTVGAAGFPALGGRGVGANVVTGPWNTFVLAQLHLQFWRPPYFVRSDGDIVDVNGNGQEWLRYVDKHWTLTSQMLSREGGQYTWYNNVPNSQPVPGAVGIPVSRMRVTRRWYEVPESAIFSSAQETLVPNGLPVCQYYTQTLTANPVTSFQYTPGQPLPGCVNSPIGGGSTDTDFTLRMFGSYMGTLLYEGVEYVPRPLHLPAALMQIPPFKNNEPISQQQYDVVFHYSVFDPPRGKAVPFRGHNLLPYAGDGQFYPVISQAVVDAGNPYTNHKTTPFQYADLTDMFTVL